MRDNFTGWSKKQTVLSDSVLYYCWNKSEVKMLINAFRRHWNNLCHLHLLLLRRRANNQIIL